MRECAQYYHSLHTYWVDATAYTSARFGQGEGPTYLEDVRCTGGEDSLLQCHHKRMGCFTCPHYKDAGVSCSNGMNLFAEH